jgi:hypothetical protein
MAKTDMSISRGTPSSSQYLFAKCIMSIPAAHWLSFSVFMCGQVHVYNHYVSQYPLQYVQFCTDIPPPCKSDCHCPRNNNLMGCFTKVGAAHTFWPFLYTLSYFPKLGRLWIPPTLLSFIKAGTPFRFWPPFWWFIKASAACSFSPFW